MNEISPSQLLSQIRALNDSLNAPALPGVNETPPSADFGAMLRTTLDSVSDAQQASRDLKVGFENGTGSASLAEVMISSQKADLAFRAVTEVRNKLVTAYQDIMNMPV